MSALVFCMVSVKEASASGSSQSSLSTKYTISPLHFLMALFFAMAVPWLFWCITFILLSFAAYSSQMAGELSGLPSSTIHISQSLNVC